MLLTHEQLESYEKDGFVFLPDYFSREEVERMKAEVPAIFAEESPRRVVEKKNGIVRSVYGSHLTNEVFGRLSRHPRIIGPARQVLGGEVYVYQFKINAKVAFDGDLWEWHQDYVFWCNEDGMPAPRVISAAVYLDEITEYNGPMFMIPGSHREGVIEVAPHEIPAYAGVGSMPYQNSPKWITNLTADLKYSLDRETVARLVSKYGITAPKGGAGSVLFFHGNTIHASPNNLSPFDRVVVIVTLNDVRNVPVSDKPPRPDFLNARNREPIVALSDDALMKL